MNVDSAEEKHIHEIMPKMHAVFMTTILCSDEWSASIPFHQGTKSPVIWYPRVPFHRGYQITVTPATDT